MIKMIIPTTAMDIYTINKKIPKLINLIFKNIFHIF